MVSARGAHLPHALRRSLVDGHPVDRISAGRSHQAARAHVARPSTWPSPRKLDPEQMPGQKRSVLDWPYVEGLRMDEAMNPLAILAVGLYGRVLPNQNGAPLRLVVPWKYGFKGIKASCKMRFVDLEPPTTWTRWAPTSTAFTPTSIPRSTTPLEPGQRAPHRRASRARPLPFNGYADQVAGLYAGHGSAKSSSDARRAQEARPFAGALSSLPFSRFAWFHWRFSASTPCTTSSPPTPSPR